MPGIFGAVCVRQELRAALEERFRRPWTTCESVAFDNGILGGHAFLPKTAIHVKANTFVVAVDGELPIYTDAELFVRAGAPELFKQSTQGLTLTERCTGNVAVADLVSKKWYLACEWSGTFPLYYTHSNIGLLFCGRVRPLAELTSAAIDEIGVIERLLKGYTLAGRTLYAGIRRLLPGQVLTYRPESNHVQISETSRLWAADSMQDLSNIAVAAETAGSALKLAVERRANTDEKHALMLSAGWDSRLLLFAMLSELGQQGLYTYTHGDLYSLEVKIVRSIRQKFQLSGDEEALCSGMFDAESLKRVFDRTESIMFPEWVHGGSKLAQLGLTSVACGAYGEVLGGHYGSSAALKGTKRVLIGFRQLLAQSLGLRFGFGTDPARLFQVTVEKPSCLSEEFWCCAKNAREAISEDVSCDLGRLRNRGVVHDEQMVEAFISEHRGTQYIETQPLACRANLDVIIPYIDRSLLNIASRIPMSTKFQNAVHREILRNEAPKLLQFPSSATILPAYMPLPVQELARVARRIVESHTWRLYFVTHGSTAPPHFGWPNYEFLRPTRVLESLVRDLESDIWNKSELYRWLVRAGRFLDHRQMLFICQPLLSIYCIDLMLRRRA